MLTISNKRNKKIIKKTEMATIGDKTRRNYGEIMAQDFKY